MDKIRPIKTYEDLEKEEQRLTARLAVLKVDIREDIQEVKQGVKDKLNPIKKVKHTVHNLMVRETENGKVVTMLVNLVTDFFVRLVIPNRTSVLTKTIIPFISRNYVSHLITDEQRQAITKSVNGAIMKADQFIQKALKKKENPHPEPEIRKVEPEFTEVNKVNTNPMNL